MKNSFTIAEMSLAYNAGKVGYYESFGEWAKHAYPEQPTDEQILTHFGWECICQSPYELQHTDGSFASGQAAYYLLDGLKDEYKNEMDGY